MAQTTAELGNVSSAEAPVAHHRVGWGQVILRFLRRDKIGAAAFAVLAFFVFLAIFGPFLTSDDQVTDLTMLYSQPSREHILGTDYAGHDIFTQVVRGTRSVMVVGVLAAAMSTVFAVTLGALSALFGGPVDSGVLLLTDVVLTIPYIIFLGVLAAFV